MNRRLLVLIVLVIAAMVLTAGAYTARFHPDLLTLFAPQHNCGGG